MQNKNFSFKILRKDNITCARVGTIFTPHGAIQTPAFSPVATRATVKTLDPSDLINAGSQVVLANTYHLYLRPGIKIIEDFGGFAPFMKWDGPTITDSGGYQVSFLWSPSAKASVGQDTSGQESVLDSGRVAKITDEGATFISHIDGARHLLSPEKSMEIQHSLAADIIMALDQPLGKDFSEKKKREAFERTLRWEERSFVRWNELETKRKKGTFQALYGIMQGGINKDQIRKSLEFILVTGFPGIAAGGETIGTDPMLTSRTLDLVSDLLPDDKPLHALGLGGGPEGIFEAVERGVDTFDNTSITRQARSGLLFLYPEDGGKVENKFRMDIKKSKFKDIKEPFSKVCNCYSCSNFSAAYLHHLIISGELLGLRLASIHNVHFINDLMKKIREAILNGDFIQLKREWI
ncbi:MAG: hypothetical protein A3D24_01405 [Candidatus Blackburnbacteria bacterium RIFCSPHIGHO2_02_FULL_39_13]|uniref:tRNA-guanine(15) transglycosylase-like domain-containing protein n=1 Tax=Candidatus Blackburnbacteria bacterium RIFCSPLOWO2_01_FULL_40_20 TaxID=1797519 RepID=A0A1G1VFD6_9BACT|nr:MAG: Queuine tRNA-ribosyltransferase [Microgenomates group bacterium GW2011_GWA2_39_19]OGY06786.1 MAG: hypothetical protein A2694_00510 [Candidatus Blackburnbacteria bacterium RIFCSPHIGHO2_01_FULL_40_17]OGY09801.1 MAG: hypothetical protein A3D24_01405 [Candidatus Blackburnbacteria bacterium RIFCSPHIGHO2_02_FULL_39_13]OGY14081.1 MAG: hypothetical protein A3A77_03850 [Candidatus Blackburnbacteria bacterium RIFCSPLOWO2_01_FULL_40_20]HBL52283.1 tRNA guanosine(34) transglycosylase Tgt [Candidatus